MQVKKMITPDQNVRVYTAPLNVTPTEGTSSMRSRAEIQRALIVRAEELAMKEGHHGPGKFAERHYKLACQEISPEARAIERGFIPAREPGQRVRAYRHQDQLAAMYLQQGRAKTLAEAWTLANQAAPAIAAQAQALTVQQAPDGRWCVMKDSEPVQCFRTKEEADAYQTSLRGPDTETEEGARHMSLFFRDARYAAGSGPAETSHAAMRAMSREVLVRRLAASAMHGGRADVNETERAFADAWFGENFPPPSPRSGAGPATIPGSPPGSSDLLTGYNVMREATVEAILQQTRRLLSDPAERQKIRPGGLGG